MTRFKDLILTSEFNKSSDFPSVEVKLHPFTLAMKFDSKDVLLHASYTGPLNPWMNSLCWLIKGKTLNELSAFTWKTWEESFKDDQHFWDLKQEEEERFFHKPIELLKAALDVFRGKEYLYQEESPLICRCFGVRESDILEHLQAEKVPTLDSLAGVSKAGMGCRSCVPQLKRWLVLHETKKHSHHYKEKAVSEWLLEIDYMLSCFPHSLEWKMEVQKFKGNQVIISFDKDVSQKDEEKIGKELQDFLGASVDPDLGFFLRRARHFSKANG